VTLFETLDQAGAFWVLAACGLLLGALDTLLRAARLYVRDRLWARILAAPVLAVAFLGLTVAAVQYSYPYGFRLWQALLEAAVWALFLLGPGGFLLRRIRRRTADRPLRNREKNAGRALRRAENRR